MYRQFFVAVHLFAALLASSAAVADGSGFIPAAGTDISFDARTRVLYISAFGAIKRYDMNTGNFLAPIQVGGFSLSLDISPDGRTLAVANLLLAPNTSNSYLDLVDLPSGNITRKFFDRETYVLRGGTVSVAFDKNGDLLFTSSGNGDRAPLYRLNLANDQVTFLNLVSSASRLRASATREVITVAENNGYEWGYYRTGDSWYTSQYRASFPYEIVASPDGRQFAIADYSGTYIGSPPTDGYTRNIGGYGLSNPIGAAYSPLSGHIFFPFGDRSYIAEYDNITLQEVRRFDTGGRIFDQTNIEGRTIVASDGSYVFSIVDDGVFFAALAVPEPTTAIQLILGLAAIGALAGRRKHQRRNQGQV
jgi:DNA-binding beta-propeller fold protein YncE